MQVRFKKQRLRIYGVLELMNKEYPFRNCLPDPHQGNQHIKNDFGHVNDFKHDDHELFNLGRNRGEAQTCLTQIRNLKGHFQSRKLSKCVTYFPWNIRGDFPSSQRAVIYIINFFEFLSPKNQATTSPQGIISAQVSKIHVM